MTALGSEWQAHAVHASEPDTNVSLLARWHLDPWTLMGLIILACVLMGALFGSAFAPHDPSAVDIGQRLKPPAWMHGGSISNLLGTDGLGRDILSRIMVATRTVVVVCLVPVIAASVIGTGLGMVAGLAGPTPDRLVTRMIDVQLAFPGLLLAITIIAVVGPGTVPVMAVLFLMSWMVFAKVGRSAVLSVKNEDFVEAAAIVGCTDRHIARHYILPHIVPSVCALAVTELGVVILGEASLSFLGLGVQPPTISWGLDIGQGRRYMQTAWWVVTFPGVAIASTVIAANVVVDWVRQLAESTGLPIGRISE